MPYITMDEGLRLTFDRELFVWSRSLPREPDIFLKVDILPTVERLIGGRLKYIGVPESFLEVLAAKGISYQVE